MSLKSVTPFSVGSIIILQKCYLTKQMNIHRGHSQTRDVFVDIMPHAIAI